MSNIFEYFWTNFLYVEVTDVFCHNFEPMEIFGRCCLPYVLSWLMLLPLWHVYMPLYLYVEDGSTLNNLFVADVITTLRIG